MLLERARGLLIDPGQVMLDLDVEPAMPVAGLRSRMVEAALLENPGTSLPRHRDGAGRVAATGRRLLFESLAGAPRLLGFDALGDEVFRDLVIARIVEPILLPGHRRVLTDLGVAPTSYATMKRTLSKVKTAEYRDRIATACFRPPPRPVT